MTSATRYDPDTVENDAGLVPVVPGESVEETAAALADLYLSDSRWRDLAPSGEETRVAYAQVAFVARNRAESLRRYAQNLSMTAADSVVEDVAGHTELVVSVPYGEMIDMVQRNIRNRGDLDQAERMSWQRGDVGRERRNVEISQEQRLHAALVVGFLANRRAAAASSTAPSLAPTPYVHPTQPQPGKRPPGARGARPPGGSACDR